MRLVSESSEIQQVPMNSVHNIHPDRNGDKKGWEESCGVHAMTEWKEMMTASGWTGYWEGKQHITLEAPGPLMAVRMDIPFCDFDVFRVTMPGGAHLRFVHFPANQTIGAPRNALSYPSGI